LYVNATRLIRADRAQVFDFLSDLSNHWQLADGAISVVTVEPGDGGSVRLCGPLGVRRTAHTRVEQLDPPQAMSGSAQIGSRTHAHVSWSLQTRDGGTEVALSAQVEAAGVLDRLLLAAGGRAWLESRFRLILATLAERFEA
jgi:carbon monoxide dehydrogenase subunit G